MKHSFWEILSQLWFQESEKKVYTVLVKLGQASVGDIYKNCDLPRTTIKSILDRFLEKNLVVQHIQQWVHHYWVNSLESLESELYKKIGLTKDLDVYIRQIYKTQSHIPWVRIYDKKTSIRSLIESFWKSVEQNGTIYTIDSPGSKNYLLFFTQEEFITLIQKKKKKHILTQSLIPFNSFSTIPQESLTAQDIIIREMPENIHFQASLWLIEWKVVFFSGATNIIVEITNPIISLSMKSMYDFVASSSKVIYSNI